MALKLMTCGRELKSKVMVTDFKAEVFLSFL